MEPEPSKKADDAAHEKADRAAENELQGGTGESVEPIVLPVVVVPAEQTQTGEIAADAAGAADVPTVDSRHSRVEGEVPTQVQLGPEVLAPEVRDLVDRLRPGRDLELPLPSQADDGPVEEDDLTMEEAVGHFVSLAEDKMRELNLGQQDSGAHAIGTHAGPSPGDMQRAFQRHDDDRGAARQLRDSRGSDESSGLDQGATPTIPAAEAQQRESAAPMPRLQIIVQMADARDVYAEVIEEALARNAPEYREIAQSEVKLGFWRYGNERRRADWRLRA